MTTSPSFSMDDARAITTQAAPYTLSRNGKVFAQGMLQEGENLLPTGYALEAGEGEAHFTLQTSQAQAEIVLPAVLP